MRISTAHPRLESIDLFRGLAIILMVLANFIAGVSWIPAWLKHAPDIGLTIIDLIAPMFIFAIGLTYRASFLRRMEREGAFKTYQHFVTRWMAIIGIGAVISAGEIALKVDGATINWGVLQAIGASGIITLILLRLSTRWRAGIGLTLLGLYQLLLETSWKSTVLASPHGGLQGSVSWSAMLILATVLADLYEANPKKLIRYLAASFLSLGLGAGLAFFYGISKNRVSASYVLVSLGLSALGFALTRWVVEKLRWHIPLVGSWGKNPLLLYILHYLLLSVVVLPGIPAWYNQAPAWLVGCQALVLLGVLSGLAWWMDQNNQIISL